MEYNINDIKELKWRIKSVKIQLDSVNNRKADTDDGKNLTPLRRKGTMGRGRGPRREILH